MAAAAEAGRRGEAVRSDCWVLVAPADSGGLDVEVKSRVESMYGAAIRTLIAEGLDTLGVAHARVEVEDAGALPFVLMARLETAVRRAYGRQAVGSWFPAIEPATRRPGRRERFRRSRLYLPGNEPKFLPNAGFHRPDGVILDLEDSVAPAEKDAARDLVRNALRVIDFGEAERMVRINPAPVGLEDLDAVIPENVHLVLIPKCESADSVREIEERIRAVAGPEAPPVFLMPIVETALGVERAHEIACASPNIVGLTIGLEDYTADIGTQRTTEGSESFFARCAIVNAARAAGVAPIDSVFSDVADVEGLRASVLEAKGLGFEGKGCIHPAQIRVIHEAFDPASEEVAKAMRIVRAFEEAQRSGLAVVSLGSKMIDPPVVKRALRTVTLAVRSGLLVEDWRERETPWRETGMQKLERNAVGRLVPVEINGAPAIPFRGVGAHRPDGGRAAPPLASCADYPADGNKVVPDLRTALEQAGLRDGMTISTHHHFRNGDLVANRIFDTAAAMGVRDLRWFPSASFPCHAPNIRHLESGVIHHIEGSMNGPLGDYCSEGKMRGMAVLRSHGGRYQAIQDGEVHIDIAVIAAPEADPSGNANGLHGPSACGGLGFAIADAEYADRVIVVTDNPVPFPCVPWQIMGNRVDSVVVVDRVGDPEKIVSGTTQITRSPDRLLIADLTARFIAASGILRDGFSFQAGAGGTALAFALYLKELMRERGIRARFVRGGSTKYLVEMLEEGLTEYILDGQTFDLHGVRSMGTNPRHVNTSPLTSYNYHGKGNFASMVDAVVLGATEVDVNFNANVVTHSDGRLLHGIGGWQNCLFSNCTILALPSFRDRIPIIIDEVTTLCGPAELIDVVVTERGIAINPLRRDLRDAVSGSGLPIREIGEIQEEVDRLCGKPARPRGDERVIAAIKWVDGTVIDSVRQVPR